MKKYLLKFLCLGIAALCNVHGAIAQDPYIYAYAHGGDANPSSFEIINTNPNEVALTYYDFNSNVIIDDEVTEVDWDGTAIANARTFKVTKLACNFSNKYITSISLPNGLKTIGSGVFNNAKSFSPFTLVLPASLETIEDAPSNNPSQTAFGSCSAFSSVDFSQSKVKVIPQQCFASASLTSVNLEGVEVIRESAFESCNLVDVTIPASVKTIYGSAFRSNVTSNWQDNSLSSVTFEGNQTWFTDDSNYTYYTQKRGHVFDESLNNCNTHVTINNIPYYMDYHFTQANENTYGGRYAASFFTVATLNFVYRAEKEWQSFASHLDYDYDAAYEAGLRAYEITEIDAANGTVKISEVPTIVVSEKERHILQHGKGYVIHADPAHGPYALTKLTTGLDAAVPTYLYGGGEIVITDGVGTSTDEIGATDGDYTNMILKDGKFVKVSGTAKLAAGKAYLKVATATLNNAPMLSIGLDDEGTTGISSATHLNVKVDNWFDLSGRRLQGRPTQKGVYIVNGKKTIVK